MIPIAVIDVPWSGATSNKGNENDECRQLKIAQTLLGDTSKGRIRNNNICNILLTLIKQSRCGLCPLTRHIYSVAIKYYNTWATELIMVSRKRRWDETRMQYSKESRAKRRVNIPISWSHMLARAISFTVTDSQSTKSVKTVFYLLYSSRSLRLIVYRWKSIQERQEQARP